MIRDCLVSSLTAKGLKYWQNLCEIQFAREEAAEFNINTNEFTTPHKIQAEIDCLCLEHLFTTKKVILSLYDLKSKIVPEDASNIYPDDIHNWIDYTGAIELSEWIHHLKPMIYESMKKAQLDDTHPFWSTHKQTSTCIVCKHCTNIYKEFLSWKTIHIHPENTPFFDKITRYSPSPPPWSFTLRFIPDCFRCRPPDSPPQFFTTRLISDWFGDFPT